jgi:protease IV
VGIPPGPFLFLLWLESMEHSSKKSFNPLVLIFGIAGALFVLSMVASFFFVMKGGSGFQTDRHSSGVSVLSKKKSYIAVIEVKGVILDSKRTLKSLRLAEEAEEISGVLLRLNSPGGAVGPSQEIYSAVKKFKKPLVASMGSVAASGAYYIAAGTKQVFANSGTLTGSIGVIIELANLKKLYEWAKIERFAIKTGKFKDAGAEYKELSKDEREYFQALVNDSLVQFKGAVREGRKMSEAEVDAVADGRVFTGFQAKELKLVDQLGSIDDALEYLKQEAKLTEPVKLVYPAHKTPNPLEFLFNSNDDGDWDSDEEALTDTWVDAVMKRAIPGHHATLPAGMYWLWNAGR